MKNTMESKSFQLELVANAQSQVRDLLKAQMKNSVQDLIVNLFKNEVKELCGERFERKGNKLFYRAGSDPGSALIAGQRVSVKKPRVKNQDGDEVILQSYSAFQDFDLRFENADSMAFVECSTLRSSPLAPIFITVRVSNSHSAIEFADSSLIL